MIQVEHLSKFFGPVMAVNDVTFEVEKGEIVGLLGNNGAGKTTIMRVLTTYLPATSGVARVDGFDVMMDSMEVRKRIGYLPESIPLYPEMRVGEYLDYRAKLKGVERRERPRRIATVLERCRVREVERRLLGTLSKGYRQRVGLADAMLHDPPLLILDEPTDGLDPGQKSETLAMLRELGRDHTIMLSSHLLGEVERLVSRVLIIRRGHLGLNKKLSELEADAVIVLEVRGPLEQVSNVLKTTDGVTKVRSQPLEGELVSYEVRTKKDQDLREALSERLMRNGWPLRRLDLRRRDLQDRWNEINNFEDAAPALPPVRPPAPLPPPAAGAPPSTQVTAPQPNP
jgi:ABC-2 type transport system ATP-binding protein